MDGRAVEGVDDLMRVMVGDLIGSTVRLDVVREGAASSVDVVPVELA